MRRDLNHPAPLCRGVDVCKHLEVADKKVSTRREMARNRSSFFSMSRSNVWAFGTANRQVGIATIKADQCKFPCQFEPMAISPLSTQAE